MPDSFFASKSRKRKRSTTDRPRGGTNSRTKREGTNSRTKREQNRSRADEEIHSDLSNEDVDDVELRPPPVEVASGDEYEDETPAEKRLRLAQLYLDGVKEELADGEFDAAELDKELISARIKQDVLEHSGKVHQWVADSLGFSANTPSLRTGKHRLSLTSATATESGSYLFTSGKEGCIVKWDLATGRRLHTFRKCKRNATKAAGTPSEETKSHSDEVLALAISGDEKYLVSAGKDRTVCVWDVEKNEWVRGFRGHRDTISALAFRKGTNQLYTASFDRTLKLFDLSESVMGYVETLFGHQDAIVCLDALRAETAVSAGSRDKTVRFWKIVQETQLVFRGGAGNRLREVLDGALEALEDGGGDEAPIVEDANFSRKRNAQGKVYVEGSIECVAMIDESTFLSGGDSGSICLYATQKKKAVFTQPLAHGLHSTLSSTEQAIQTPRWITSLACLRYSDLFASGSWDGAIRLWKLAPSLREFSAIGTIPAPGVVNSLQFITAPRSFAWASPAPKSASRPKTMLLIAGMGQEHRLGRWVRVKEGAKNCALVFALRPKASSD